MNLLCIDIFHTDQGLAKIAGLVVRKNENEESIIEIIQDHIIQCEDYIPGEFYKKELPGILQILPKIKSNIDLIVLDSYASLGQDKGLGIKLKEALNVEIPIIGVAKNEYKGIEGVMQLYRGDSKHPLFITTVDYPIDEAYQLIIALDGKFRIPTVLKAVDQLSRNLDFGPETKRLIDKECIYTS